METPEPQQPPTSTPGRSSEPRFTTSLRGYDRAEVAGYVKGVTARMRALQARVDELEAQLEGSPGAPVDAAGERANQFDEMSERVAEVMRALDRDVERTRTEAEAEAERTVADAQAEADRIRVDAETKADELLAQAGRANEAARERIDAAVTGLESRRDVLLQELLRLRAWMVDTVEALGRVVASGATHEDVVVHEDAVRAGTQAAGDRVVDSQPSSERNGPGMERAFRRPDRRDESRPPS